MEVEFVAATACACQAIWFRRLLDELKFKESEGTMIFSDNNSAIQLSKNPVVLHRRSKHIDVKIYFLSWDLSNNETIDLIYCRSEDQVVDIFNKALKTESFMKLRMQLGICTIKDVNWLLANISLGGIYWNFSLLFSSTSL